MWPTKKIINKQNAVLAFAMVSWRELKIKLLAVKKTVTLITWAFKVTKQNTDLSEKHTNQKKKYLTQFEPNGKKIISKN